MVLMLRGASVLLSKGDGFWIEPADIIIAGDTIQAAGRGLDPGYFQVDEVVACERRLAIPGLVNAHLHSHDRFDKGRFDNLPLEIWMSLYNPPYESREWTRRQSYLRTILNGIELLRSGVTTVIDDVHHGLSLSEENVEAVLQAYTDLGLRARVSAAYGDRPFYRSIPFLEEILPDELKKGPVGQRPPTPGEILRLWESLAQRWQGQVRFVLSPSGPQRCSDDFSRQTWNLAEKYQIPVITHVLETQVQAYTGYAFYGKSLVEHMDALRILNPLTVLVHAVWVNERDIELIARSGAAVVHNPGSNLKLGSGIAPVRRFLDSGIPVGLGTDNNNANDSANLFEAMKLAALIHKVGGADFEQWVGARDAFKMATLGGALCAGLHDQIGSLRPGMQADLVLLDLDSLPLFPANNLLNQLVFAEHGESIQQVMVAGKVVFDQGHITMLDERKILGEIQEEAQGILERISRTSAAGRRLEPYLRAVYEKCMEQAARED
jgi:5-methylthioadenosine/S-adenosylhomocysteine deaminase